MNNLQAKRAGDHRAFAKPALAILCHSAYLLRWRVLLLT